MQKMILTAAERLIVAADFKPEPGQFRIEDWVRCQVIALAVKLKGTGVCLKVNSALRICGYDLIRQINNCGLDVFADLKFKDISETLTIDGMFLGPYQPKFVTVCCDAGLNAMRAFKAAIPSGVEVLGVTALTTFDDDESYAIYGCPVEEAVDRLAKRAIEAGLDGFIASGKEAPSLRAVIGNVMTINTPAIRPLFAKVVGDDQNKKRSMTPAEAIEAGADRIIVGRPITQANNPLEAAWDTISEIATTTAT